MEQEQEHGTGADEPQQESAAKTMDATPSSPIRIRRWPATTGNGGVVRGVREAPALQLCDVSVVCVGGRGRGRERGQRVDGWMQKGRVICNCNSGGGSSRQPFRPLWPGDDSPSLSAGACWFLTFCFPLTPAVLLQSSSHMDHGGINAFSTPIVY
jgi:hypothetical protein